MKVSKNEITALLKQVFEGLKFRCGEYESAADMIVWAEMCGLSGLLALRHSLPYLTEQSPPPLRSIHESETKAVLDANNGSSLNCADVVMNLAYTKALAQECCSVTVLNCHNRKLFVKTIADCGNRGMSCLAYWRDAIDPVALHVVITAADSDGMPSYSTYKLSEQSFIEDSQRQSLFIECSTKPVTPDDHIGSLIADGDNPGTNVLPAALQNNYHASLMQGLSIEEDLWTQLQALAQIVLVESSEQSRMGAGA